MNSKVDIQGDVGVAVNAESNSNIHITVNQAHRAERRVGSEVMRSVHILLKTCEKHNLKPSLEAIAQLIFGSDHFKSLSVDDLSKLQLIAEEFNDKLNRMQSDFEAKHDNRDEVDFNKFYEQTKIHASTPERAALRLLFKENVTPPEVKLVRSEILLEYKDDNQLHLNRQEWRAWVGWPIAGFSLLMLVAAMFAAKIIALTYKAPPFQQGLIAIAFMAITIGVAAISAYLAIDFLKPYFIAKRIKSLVENVNQKLRRTK